MFEDMKRWCNNHGFAWKIVNGRFFWLTNYQTGEIDENNHIKWHHKDYFTTN